MKFNDDDHFVDDEERENRKRSRVFGAIAFALFFVAVGCALVTVFVYFTNNWTLAILLVGFMMLYMTWMGWLAGRKADDKDV